EMVQAFQKHSIDLEMMARHRGRVFSRFFDEEPPAQATFENRLGVRLHAFARASTTSAVLVEDESRTIGPNVLPERLFRIMQNAPIIWIDAPAGDRAMHLVEEYVSEPLRAGVSAMDLEESLRK